MYFFNKFLHVGIPSPNAFSSTTGKNHIAACFLKLTIILLYITQHSQQFTASRLILIDISYLNNSLG